MICRRLLFTPKADDTIHLAISENNDWNVYKLHDTGALISYVGTSDGGASRLYTDVSLMNYLDTNQLGLDNTGKYLDYYLTLQNAKTVENVVVWTNEEIVREEQTKIINFEAPRMIESMIEYITPTYRKPIAEILPAESRQLSLTITWHRRYCISRRSTQEWDV